MLGRGLTPAAKGGYSTQLTAFYVLTFRPQWARKDWSPLPVPLADTSAGKTRHMLYLLPHLQVVEIFARMKSEGGSQLKWLM